MGQSKNFSGKPIISQILALIPRDLIYRTATRYGSDRYVKTFKTYDHLVTLLFGVLSDCTSLRELSTALLACEGKVSHLAMDQFPKRSTLSDANSRRDPKVFEHIYYALLEMYRGLLPDSSQNKGLLQKLFIIDSTTVTLFKAILKGTSKAVDGKKKGGLKIHTLIQANEDVPCLVNLTAAAASDRNFLSQIHLPSGSWLVFDRGYNNQNFYKTCGEKGVFFVTRQNDNAMYEVMGDLLPTGGDSVKVNEVIFIKRRDLVLRRIVWFDKDHHRTFTFLTNNFDLPAEVIAAIYKRRWQIESLFKRIKQNFTIQYFLGDSENAIKTQVWVCLIAHLLLKVIQMQVAKKWAFSNLAALIKYHLMSYIRLFDFLLNPLASYEVLSTKPRHQFLLFPT
jgi:hypothetical protein